jgi:hypothetical protein
MYDAFVQHSLGKKCCTKFHRKYPDNTLPIKAMTHNTVTKLYSMGSMLHKNKSQKSHVLIEEKLEIHIQLQRRPEKSLHPLSLQLQ